MRHGYQGLFTCAHHHRQKALTIIRDLNDRNESDFQVSPAVPPSRLVPLTGDSLVSPVLNSSLHADAPLTGHKLNSFIPIFKLLGPKFVLDQNAYYIHGVVNDSELGILRDYTSMVTELALDSDVEDIKSNISPSAFIHLAQLLKPNSPLLPSLLRLCIIQADTYFAYLHLLHTPSLKTLEVTNVPDHQHPTFFSFLTTLIHKAPLLEDIILGPGRFPSNSLLAILKFIHLHQLELRDAASTIDFGFLQDVGTLPNLESFILDARSCEYTSRIQEKQSTTPAGEDTGTEIRSQIPRPLSDVNVDGPSNQPMYITTGSPMLKIYEDDEADRSLRPTYDPIPPSANSSTSRVGGFHQLKRFHFVGGLPLIQDMIAYIASNTLEDISIHLSAQDLKKEAQTEAENTRQVEAEERRRKMDQETLQRIASMEIAMKSKNSSVIKRRRQEILDDAEIQWKEQEAQYQEIEEERQKAERVQNNLRTASVHIAILQTVSSRWSANLKTLKFNQLNDSSQALFIPLTLPKEVYGTLFCHPKIEILDFKRWKLDSVEDFLFSLKTSGPKNLKHLHMPIDDPRSTAVALSGLLDIAEACPMLESLECCINTLLPIPEYSIPATTKGHFHGLQTLTVSNSTSFWDFNQLLLVARHIYLVFPHLQTIDNMEGPNAGSEQWVRIRDLVKMFQTIREDNRFLV